MIQLKEEDFSNLMHDFYAVFAPQKLETLPVLIGKYKDTPKDQRNAIQTAYLIYYKPSNAMYKNFSDLLPEVGTEKNIIKLMESYANGERLISPERQSQLNKEEEEKNIKKRELIEKQQEEINNKEKSKFSNLEKDLTSKIKTLEEELAKSKEISNKVIYNNVFEEMDVEITSFIEPEGQYENGKTKYKNYDYSNLIMPHNKYISTFCIGQRVLLKEHDGSIVGVEVSNIYDDYISNEDKPIRFLELKKV